MIKNSYIYYNRKGKKRKHFLIKVSQFKRALFFAIFFNVFINFINLSNFLFKRNLFNTLKLLCSKYNTFI